MAKTIPATSTAPMAYSVINWTDSDGFNVRLGILSSTGVPAVDACTGRLFEKLGEYREAERQVAAARKAVERIPDDARAAAIEAGGVGAKVDKKAVRRNGDAARERLEDARLDQHELAAALYGARTEYLATVSQHMPHLLSNARDIAESASLTLTTAREMARRAATALTAAVVVMGAGPLIASGETSPQLAPIPGRDFQDAGHPGIWAELADEPLVKAIGWSARWLAHSKVLEAQWNGEKSAEADAEAAEAARVAEAEAAAAAKFAIQ